MLKKIFPDIVNDSVNKKISNTLVSWAMLNSSTNKSRPQHINADIEPVSPTPQTQADLGKAAGQKLSHIRRDNKSPKASVLNETKLQASYRKNLEDSVYLSK